MSPNNCPILERTADGTTVGRCWFYLKDGHCPRHGNVKYAQQYYLESRGSLTDEIKHNKRKLTNQPKLASSQKSLYKRLWYFLLRRKN